MDTFQAADGSNQTRLNLVQSRIQEPVVEQPCTDIVAGSFETLSRPKSAYEGGRDAAEEPLSGVGAS